VAKFKVLYQHFLRKTERNQEELWTRRPLGRGLNLGRPSYSYRVSVVTSGAHRTVRDIKAWLTDWN
jgi:hypothetical protein